MKNQKINCTVYDCKHCDVMNDACKLNQIKVACCRATDDKESTINIIRIVYSGQDIQSLLMPLKNEEP